MDVLSRLSVDALERARRNCAPRPLKRPWSETEDALMRERYPHEPMAVLRRLLGRSERSIYARADALGLSKTAEYLSGPHACRLRREDNPGIQTRFQRGQIPWNKGKSGTTGSHPNTRRTQFKKGEMRGAAQHNYVPVGSHRISKDGYLEIKANDDHPVPARRWVGAHRLAWEAAHGPIPDGHIVVFRPGMRTTDVEQITVDRLELITRSENMRRNTRHRYPPELKATMYALRKLRKEIEHANS